MSHFNSEFNVIYLRVVQGCNLNCTHCFTLGNKDPYLLANLDEIRMFLSAIRSHVNPRKAVFYIHGGETFLAPLDHLRKVNEIIRQVFNDIHFDIIPQTNLMYTINDEYIQFVKNEYSSHIGVSWDYGIRFETTGRGLNEDLFFKNFQKLVNAEIEMSVAITVQKNLLKATPQKYLPLFNGAKSLDFEFLTLFDQKTRDLKVNNDEWSEYLYNIVQYYAHNQTTWSMPQVDLFTKSFIENKIYNCKCNCCQHRTFTFNCNGQVGLCPDDAYINPVSNVQEMNYNWSLFQAKAQSRHLEQITQPIHTLCQKCEFFDVCGGNCEPSLFDAVSSECPLSKKTLRFQRDNMNLFRQKLDIANENLIELRNKGES